MSTAGKKVVRSFNMHSQLLSEIDKIAQKIKQKTGLQVDRSKLFSAFAELLSASEKYLNPEEIVTQETLKYSIAKAITHHLNMIHPTDHPKRKRPTESESPQPQELNQQVN
jgi:hypothetical protein